jgi:UbiD family decarboxylase
VAVISVKQQYLGHAKQVGVLASTLFSGGACTGRYVIVVDDDIDPADWEAVMWALTTRCDPETAIEIVTGYLSGPLDPMISPTKRQMGDYTTAKVIINACRPYHWIKEFPPVNMLSEESKKKILDKWPAIFG